MAPQIARALATCRCTQWLDPGGGPVAREHGGRYAALLTHFKRRPWHCVSLRTLPERLLLGDAAVEGRRRVRPLLAGHLLLVRLRRCTASASASAAAPADVMQLTEHRRSADGREQGLLVLSLMRADAG